MEKISTAEFEVMRVIWANQPIFTKDIINILKVTQDWSDSTVKTLLTRLTKKKFVDVTQIMNKYQYTTVVNKEEYIKQEITSLMAKICDTEKSKLIIDLLKTIPMNQTDIQIITTLLQEKHLEHSISCHCPKGYCENEKI